MNDNEIIKALECCSLNINVCDYCPIDQKNKDNCNCGMLLTQCSLDLINRKTAEIERLKGSIMAGAEVVRAVEQELKTAKVEAIKEFAERLKEKRDGGTYPYVLVNVIDNLVKEMVGDDNA
jgi:hypothetical protein